MRQMRNTWQWMMGAAVAALLCSCASDRPVAPLVPLPDSQMPAPDALQFRPWRVVVSESGGRHVDLERSFTAQIKHQLSRYGILNVNSDARTNELLQRMLHVQARSGEEINVSDLKYEIAHADGVISVTVTAMTIPKRNAVTSWFDKKKQRKRVYYTSEVAVSGYYTLVIPKTGNARTVQFNNSQTQTSYDEPHQFSAQQLALNAVRQAARSSRVVQPLYTQFPLIGYVIGVGAHGRDIRINRGLNQGVQRDRKWDLLMVSREANALMGEIVSEQVIGTARTHEVFADHCVARCDSGRTRERAKLGMKARARDFGFSFAGLFNAN